jgi:chromate transporter
VLVGGPRFDQLRASRRVQAFLAGAGPASLGAIAGSAIPLALALSEWWQLGVTAVAAVALFALGREVVVVLVGAGVIGVVAALAGAPVPR